MVYSAPIFVRRQGGRKEGDVALDFSRATFVTIAGGLCSLVSAQAQQGGTVIQAFGGDPEWVVTISPDGLSYSHDEADYPVFHQLAAPSVMRRDGQPVYRTQFSDGRPVELRVATASCERDGEILPMRATLKVGTKTFDGCARLIDYYDFGKRPVVGDLSMDSRIESRGGPKGFKLILDDRGSVLSVDGRDYPMGRPAEVVLSGKPWPVVADDAATFDLASDDDTTTAKAIITAVRCDHGGKTYPLSVTVTFSGSQYRSCAAQAYMVLDMSTVIPTIIADPR